MRQNASALLEESWTVSAVTFFCHPVGTWNVAISNVSGVCPNELAVRSKRQTDRQRVSFIDLIFSKGKQNSFDRGDSGTRLNDLSMSQVSQELRTTVPMKIPQAGHIPKEILTAKLGVICLPTPPG